MKRRYFAMRSGEFTLTVREYAGLETLIARIGALVSKAMVTTTVFGNDDEANPNVSETYSYRRRKKLAGRDLHIFTSRGVGYVLALRALQPAT